MLQYKVEVPDYRYWRRQINCQDACPVHTDARGYVRAISEGKDELAYLIARGPNPLASICGRICGAPCEVNCRRGKIDQPIAIRALKRFVADSFGPEAGTKGIESFKEWLQRNLLPQLCQGRDELLWLLRRQSPLSLKQKKVAIIGSGPAGLACAHDLALLGLQPIIYEMEPVAAGMLYLGVPEYRLPRDVIRAEVALIESLGAEIRCGIQIGKDIAFESLTREHDAVVVAVGAKRSRGLRLPGIDGPGVLGGVDFLRDVALRNPVDIGKRVVVIGGGNVAYDVSRTVLRQEFFDSARTAVRVPGVREVTLCCLESLIEMPADDVEIVEGAEEGITLRTSLGPKEIIRDDQGRVTGAVFQKVLRVYDENKRFAPEFDPAELTTIECDTVLLAVGQASDLSFIDPAQTGIEISDRGIPSINPQTMQSTAASVFFAGDVAHGPRLMIDAIASGKKAARSVFEFLTGNSLDPRALELHFEPPAYRREKGYERLARVKIPVTDPSLRLKDKSLSVEKGYNEARARVEASRCLDCGINTIFDSEKCVLCGGCADVCPTLCLRLVSLDNLESNDEIGALARSISLLDPGKPLSAIIKDEEKCIRCACCAMRCPTGAITMERFCFQEKLE
ncbi:MAG: 4Fe-4S dicluster domain-containing protein [Candidatus Abyssobacteria bacterium SURF_5]|uniref:4Fe-4S dicluster domain-containing protein n=1 Tax=Abyssobacteria bacterium (strain SURF_5) TaxID=2093360 RepID=A0A3A4NZA6_ABYX5|nr:MAG: 4Fe-4S dicluster domain-containing protein [Candidatus Abyssubacteria bacterium SURF_5]